MKEEGEMDVSSDTDAMSIPEPPATAGSPSPRSAATLPSSGPAADDIRYRRFEGSRAELERLLEALCDRILPHRPAALLEERMPFVTDPDLLLAEHHGMPVAFKLAYRTSKSRYLSWLGGVDEGYRRLGIASRLMDLQHDHLRSIGVEAVETRTRSNNRPMLILNLRAGFDIVGFETDAFGRSLVMQRKQLGDAGADG